MGALRQTGDQNGRYSIRLERLQKDSDRRVRSHDPLDVMGPHYFLAKLRRGHQVCRAQPLILCRWKRAGDHAHCNVRYLPKDLTRFFVGGGYRRQFAAIWGQSATPIFADRGSRKKRVTSVCIGSLLLGQAGLLQAIAPPPIGSGSCCLAGVRRTEVDERVSDRTADGGRRRPGWISRSGFAKVSRPLAAAQAAQPSPSSVPEPPLDNGTSDKHPASAGDSS